MLKKILLILLAVLLLAGLIAVIGRAFDANKKLKDRETTVIPAEDYIVTDSETEVQTGLRNMGAETTPDYGLMIGPNH